MKNSGLIFLAFLFLWGCSSRQDDSALPSPFENGRGIQLNTDEGYFINQITGDSITPNVNLDGNEISSGVESPFKPDSVKSLSEGPPITIKLSEPRLQGSIDNQKTLTIPPEKKALKDYYITSFEVKKSGPLEMQITENPWVQGEKIKAGPVMRNEGIVENIERFDIDQGLFSSYSLDIICDSRGEIWIGSINGLTRFDGIYFERFAGNEGLSDDNINDILEDSKGNIWFTTSHDGVYCFNGETFTNYRVPDTYFNTGILQMHEDKNGHIWIVSASGLVEFDGTNFYQYEPDAELETKGFTSLVSPKEGYFILGTQDKGFAFFDGSQYHIYEFEASDGRFDRYAMMMADSSLWMGTKSSILMLDQDSVVVYGKDQGIDNGRFISGLQDNYGNYWFCGNYGVIKMSDNHLTQYRLGKELLTNRASDMKMDREGNVWVAHHGGGVSIFQQNGMSHYSTKVGLSHNIVYGLVEDKDGRIWCGTEQKGVDFLEDGSFYHLTSQAEMPLYSIRDMKIDSSNAIWMGGRKDGMASYENGTFTHYNVNTSFGITYVQSLLVDQDQNIWSCAIDQQLIVKFDREKFHFYSTEPFYGKRGPNLIYQDTKGNFWVGSKGSGVLKFNDESCILYTEKEGLSSNRIWAFYEDKQGNIWIGTSQGVNIFDGEKFTVYTTSEGLSNNKVWTIGADRENNIWLGTDKGITLIKDPGATEDLSNLKLFTFQGRDGLKGLDFYENAILFDSKNRLWLGSGQGVEMIQLDEFNIDNRTTVNLSSIAINQRKYDYRNLKNSDSLGFRYEDVEPFYNYPKGLVLDHDKNHLTFYFSAINWSAPHKIKYSYKIDELNEGWSVPSSQNIAEYRNLPYGNYTLKSMRNWRITRME